MTLTSLLENTVRFAKQKNRRNSRRKSRFCTFEQLSERQMLAVDLAPNELLISPESVEVGDIVSVKTTVVNGGTTRSPSFNAQYFLSEDQTFDSSDTIFGEETRPSIAGRISPTRIARDVSFPNLTIPNVANGTYYFGVIVDRADDISESNESNNIRWASGTISVSGGTNPVPDPVVADGIEPNDNVLAATDHGNIAGLTRVDNLTLHMQSRLLNRDWHRFHLQQTGTTGDYIEVQLDTPDSNLGLVLYSGTTENLQLVDVTHSQTTTIGRSLEGLAPGDYFIELAPGLGPFNAQRYALEIKAGTVNPTINRPPSVELQNAITEIDEDVDTTNRVKVADIIITDDNFGTNGLSLSGADANLFEIDGNELFIRANAILNAQLNSTLNAIIEVDDLTIGQTPDDTATVQIEVLATENMTQNVLPSSSAIVVPAGGNVSFQVGYGVSDGDNTLSGIGFRIHFDSSKLDLVSITDRLPTGLITTGTLTPEPDSEDLDNDSSTDSFVALRWADLLNGAWPGTALPTSLLTANFSLADGLTQDDTTEINFSELENSPNYGLSADSITVVAGPRGSLDVDGNGEALALSDGLLIFRYLFGIRGADLVNGAVESDATRNTSEQIVSYLDSIRDDILDADGNGETLALSDGLLVFRYLFDIQGANLVNGAVESNAARTTPEDISSYLTQFQTAQSGSSADLQALAEAEGMALDSVQVVSPNPESIAITAPSDTVSFDASYDSSDSTLSGIGVRIHFDSSRLSFQNLSNVLQASLVSQKAIELQDDTASDFDNDPTTDKFVTLRWADLLGSAWPGGELPTTLFTATFVATAEFDNGSTDINFTEVETAAGFTFASTSVGVSVDRPSNTPRQNSLNAFDVNDDGDISPIDALIVINHLNSSGSMGPSNSYLDTSGDGTVSPLDALLVINQLNDRAGTSVAEGEAMFPIETRPVRLPEIPSASDLPELLGEVASVYGQTQTPKQEAERDTEADEVFAEWDAVSLLDSFDNILASSRQRS